VNKFWSSIKTDDARKIFLSKYVSSDAYRRMLLEQMEQKARDKHIEQMRKKMKGQSNA
jgi:hypothetical protein